MKPEFMKMETVDQQLPRARGNEGITRGWEVGAEEILLGE